MTNSPRRTLASTRKRRTRVVAAILLLCAGAMLWICWPVRLNEVEKQFIGTWTPLDSPGSVFMTFNANRTVTYKAPKAPIAAGSWWADSDELFFDEGIGDKIQSLVSQFRQGGPDIHLTSLLSVSENRFRVFIPVNRSTIEMARVASPPAE